MSENADRYRGNRRNHFLRNFSSLTPKHQDKSRLHKFRKGLGGSEGWTHGAPRHHLLDQEFLFNYLLKQSDQNSTSPTANQEDSDTV